MSGFDFEAVLFDLDGTLADTAPDLAGALNRIRGEHGLAPLDPFRLRVAAGRGAAGMLEAGLPDLDPEARAGLRPRFLDYYLAECWQRSRPFPGIEALLRRLEAEGIAWGVVTNKPGFLAGPVMAGAGWLDRAACLVAGDSTDSPKPSPVPVLAACKELGLEPARVLFVGDDLRDVAAGRGAGSATGVAMWGYIEPGADPRDWNAGWLFDAPQAVFRGPGRECGSGDRGAP